VALARCGRSRTHAAGQQSGPVNGGRKAAHRRARLLPGEVGQGLRNAPIPRRKARNLSLAWIGPAVVPAGCVQAMKPQDRSSDPSPGAPRNPESGPPPLVCTSRQEGPPVNGLSGMGFHPHAGPPSRSPDRAEGGPGRHPACPPWIRGFPAPEGIRSLLQQLTRNPHLLQGGNRLDSREELAQVAPQRAQTGR